MSSTPHEQDERSRRDLNSSRDADQTVTRDEVLAAERDEHGGIKWGSAFFGWLTATGMAVVLTALLAAAGTAVGLAKGTAAGDAANQATNATADDATTVGIVGAIVLAVLIFVAYYCGGYVAGRMARFAGAKQGVAVWIWTLFVAVIGAVIATATGVITGPRIDELVRLPMNLGPMNGGGVLSA